MVVSAFLLVALGRWEVLLLCCKQKGAGWGWLVGGWIEKRVAYIMAVGKWVALGMKSMDGEKWARRATTLRDAYMAGRYLLNHRSMLGVGGMRKWGLLQTILQGYVLRTKKTMHDVNKTPDRHATSNPYPP